MNTKSTFVPTFLIALLLAALTVLFLAGCGQDDRQPSGELPPPGMIVYVGRVTVLAGLPAGADGCEPSLYAAEWEKAGWKVSLTPKNSDELTPDCTIYPNAGVPNQWFGMCEGAVNVPRDGAPLITVILDDGDERRAIACPEAAMSQAHAPPAVIELGSKDQLMMYALLPNSPIEQTCTECSERVAVVLLQLSPEARQEVLEYALALLGETELEEPQPAQRAESRPGNGGGYIEIKTIKGHRYAYRRWREGGVLKSQYIGKVKS